MKSVYFGHHKCASTYIIDILSTVAARGGLGCHTEFLSRRLPLGYEHEPGQQERIATAYRGLSETACAVICHGNADADVVATLPEAGGFRGFHMIRDPRDMLVSGYFWHRSAASMTKQTALEAMGYAVNRSAQTFPFAGVHGISLWDGQLDGGADPQRDGYAAGVVWIIIRSIGFDWTDKDDREN